MFGRKAEEIRLLRRDLELAQGMHSEALARERAIYDELQRRAETPVLPGASWAILGSETGVITFSVMTREQVRSDVRMKAIPINKAGMVARVPEFTHATKLTFTDFTQIVYGRDDAGRIQRPAEVLRELAAQWSRKL